MLRTIALAACAVGLVACGSTVQLAPTGSSGATPGAALSGDGLSLPTSPSAPVDTGVPTPTVAPPAATADSSTPSAQIEQPSAVASATDPATAPTSSLPIVGVTAKTISIGILTADGFDKTAGDLGFSVAVGNTHNEALAIVNYLNAHGGMAGRRIVPVFYDINVGRSTTNHAAEEQAACTALTQDNHIYAYASAVGWDDTLFYSCLRRAGVIASSAGEAFDQDFFRSDGDYFYMPVEMNQTRVMSLNVDALAKAGFFKSWNPLIGNPAPGPVKVGVIRKDSATDLRVLNQGIKPALARHGLKVADSVALSASVTQVAAQYAGAVLRFKSEGITHVLFTYASPLLFSETAQTQAYFPRYGLESRDSPGSLLEGNAPTRQLHGSMGLGWQQYNDVDGAHDPGPPSSRTKLCNTILRKAGQASTARATGLVGLWYCDTLFFLHDALAAAPNLSVAGFRQGAESLTHFKAASTFRSGFAPGRLHDGAQGYRMFAYNDSCRCFTYTSGLRSAS